MFGNNFTKHCSRRRLKQYGRVQRFYGAEVGNAVIVALGGTGVLDGIGVDVDVGTCVADGVRVGSIVAVGGRGVSVEVDV